MSIDKKEVENQVEALQNESKELFKERAALDQRQRLIEIRLSEIQGGVNVLIPLLQEKEKKEKSKKD